MFMGRLLLPLLLPLLAAGQMTIPGPLQPFGALKEFLALTDAQVEALVQSQSDQARFASERQSRLLLLRFQIAQETAKEQLDPVAIGTLYVEVETICREIRDNNVAAGKRNLALLTDPQRAKLKTLEDLQKLLPALSQAQAAGLIAGGIAAGLTGATAIFQPGITGSSGADLVSTTTTFLGPILAGCPAITVGLPLRAPAPRLQ
jgi:hypothetical protein